MKLRLAAKIIVIAISRIFYFANFFISRLATRFKAYAKFRETTYQKPKGWTKRDDFKAFQFKNVNSLIMRDTVYFSFGAKKVLFSRLFEGLNTKSFFILQYLESWEDVQDK